jgi:hypothetical protein
MEVENRSLAAPLPPNWPIFCLQLC